MRLWQIVSGLCLLGLLAWFSSGCQKQCEPGKDVNCWIQALGNAEQLEKAVEELKGLGDKKAEAALIETFKSAANKPKTRENIAEVFGKWRTKAAVKPMLDAIDFSVGPNKDGRKAKATNRANQKIASALARIGDASAVGHLQRLLGSTKENNIRRATIRALGKLKAKSSVDDMLRLVSDKNAHRIVRANAIYALGDIGDPKAIGPLVKALYAERAQFFAHASLALAKIGEPAIGLLVKTMNGQNAEVKKLTEGNVEALAGAMEGNAAQVLGYIGSPKAVDALLAMADKVGKWEAETNQMLVMTRLLTSLGNIGDKRAVPIVLKYLEKDFWDVRLVLANALTNIGDRSVVPELLKWAQKGAHPRTRAPLIEAIGNLGTEEILEEVKQMQQTQKDRTVSKAIGDAILRIQAHAACKDNASCWKGKLKDKQSPVREKAIYELGRLGDSKAIDELIPLIGDSSEYVRWALINAFDRLKSPKVADPMEEHLKKEKGSARFKNVNYNYELMLARTQR